MEHRGSLNVVCLGEALVDFVSESPVERITEARAFVPSLGGSQANVAIGAARFGARSALIGCAGTDAWGAWLRAGLEAERVDVSMFELRDDVQTTMAFVALSAEGEPSFSIYGGAQQGFLTEDAIRLVRRLPAGVLAFGSDALIAPRDRERLGRLKAAAKERGWRVLYDPNLRGGRWRDREQMLELARAALDDVTVVKANAAEAGALTGEGDNASAAAALVRLGPPRALVTAGGDGAFFATRDGVTHIAAQPATVTDATGAGDAVAAVLAAGLARTGEVTLALAEVAMLVASRVVAVRGALTGLPPAAEASSLLP